MWFQVAQTNQHATTVYWQLWTTFLYVAEAPFDCDGNCVNDADGDGVCDDKVLGCDNILACNYDQVLRKRWLLHFCSCSEAEKIVSR